MENKDFSAGLWANSTPQLCPPTWIRTDMSYQRSHLQQELSVAEDRVAEKQIASGGKRNSILYCSAVLLYFCTSVIYFCSDLWRGSVLDFHFHFLKKNAWLWNLFHHPNQKSVPSSCLLNVLQVCPVASQGLSVSLFCRARLFSKSLSCCHFLENIL